MRQIHPFPLDPRVPAKEDEEQLQPLDTEEKIVSTLPSSPQKGTQDDEHLNKDQKKIRIFDMGVTTRAKVIYIFNEHFLPAASSLIMFAIFASIFKSMDLRCFGFFE